MAFGKQGSPALCFHGKVSVHVVDLTRISRRHGVAVKSVGGVTIAEQASENAALVYVGDITSGDLMPLWGALFNHLDVSL